MNNSELWPQDVKVNFNHLVGCTNIYPEGSKEMELARNALKYYVRRVIQNRLLVQDGEAERVYNQLQKVEY